MWNLVVSFEDCCQTVRQLLELEYRYACRMAHLEKRRLGDTLVYTEYPLYCPGVPAELLESRLATAEDRETLWRELVIPRLQEQFEPERQEILTGHNGFLREFHTEYYRDSPELLLTLHFRNRFAPDSPFRHRRELREGLLEIVRECTAEHPEITRVQCASWLNNRPEFLAFFPEEWRRERTLCLPMEGSTGWWGSFIDCRGNFNEARAAAFERLGGFIMPNVHCRCRMSSLLRHLLDNAV